MGQLKIRGLQIDLARQKERVDYVKSYFDLAKKSDYNYVVLYLENVIRTPDTEFFDKEETYSMAEMKEMVDYAKSLGLGVIPVFENLPHIEKFLKYKELEYLSEHYDEKTKTRGYYPFRHNIGCTSNPKLYEFFDKYITDCMTLFSDSEYVMIDNDELFDFAVCDKCRERIKNGETKKDMFYKHIMHTYELVKGMNKKLVIADDFFEYLDISEELPRDIIMFTWSYGFVSGEISGHWTSKRKKDWFKHYDKLGISYMYAVYAHRGSSVYNTDSFTKFAEKYHPIGGVCTSWKKADSFYQGSYPFVYYTGKMWNGKINTEQDRIDAIAKLLDGNEELAKLLLSNTIGGSGGNFNFTERVENGTLGNYSYLNRTKYFLNELKSYLPKLKGEAKDILLDIYDFCFEAYLSAQCIPLGNDVFDSYEKGESTKKYIEKVDELIEGVKELQDNADYLWKKYKDGIVSYENALQNKYANKLKALEKAKERLSENVKYGTLTVESMLYDIYGTPRTKITVHYVDGEKQTVVNGQVKPSLGEAMFSTRYKIANKKIEKIEFTAYGEGATYPIYFYYVVDGEKYVVESVKYIEGTCKDIENIIDNDSKCAKLGIEDGLVCFNDIDKTFEMNTVEIYFKEL